MQAKLFHALLPSNSPHGKYQREDKYFGVSLDAAVEQSLAPLPAPVPFLCEYIEKAGLSTEGLFRIAGNKTKIDGIVEAFKHENKVVLEDVHDATGALKAFFRQMPEPLIPFPHYEGFVAVGEIEGDKQKVLLQAMISTLPPNHLSLLRYLMLFLHRVAKRADVNMMSEANLAIVFGPNLLRPEAEDATLSHKHSGLITKVISALIMNAKEVFSSPEEGQLSQQNTKLEAEKAKLLEERNALAEERRRAIEEKNVVMEEKNKEKEERNKAIEERNKLQGELDGLRACLAASLSAVASVQREKELARTEAATEAAALQKRVSELQQTVAELQAQNLAEKAKNEELLKQANEQTSRADSLAAQLTEAKEAASQQTEAYKKELEEKSFKALEGLLLKRSSGLPHRWQKRNCTLIPSMLYWISGDQDANKSKAEMACVFMSDVVDVEDLGSGSQAAFTIHTKTKAGVTGSLTFAAPTIQDREKWIACIIHNAAIAKLEPSSSQ